MYSAEYGKDFCGIVKLNKNGQVLRVYDAEGLAPDLSLGSSSQRGGKQREGTSSH
jgi:hypothetical protein